MPSHPTPRLTARTVPGIHNYLVDLIKQRIPPDACILDLGCGSGAFADSLARSGYNNVTVERSRNGYAARSTFFDDNRDEPFVGRLVQPAADPCYDLITAIEVLEHLESPSHPLRQCGKLLGAPGGRLW